MGRPLIHTKPLAECCCHFDVDFVQKYKQGRGKKVEQGPINPVENIVTTNEKKATEYFGMIIKGFSASMAAR